MNSYNFTIPIKFTINIKLLLENTSLNPFKHVLISLYKSLKKTNKLHPLKDVNLWLWKQVSLHIFQNVAFSKTSENFGSHFRGKGFFSLKLHTVEPKKTFFKNAFLKNTIWSYVSNQWYALLEAMESISNLSKSHAVGNWGLGQANF